MALWRKPYTLRRWKSAKYRRGYRASLYEDLEVELDVQPLSTKELEALPEGSRSLHRIKTFGSAAIQTEEQKTGRRADWLFYNGKWYTCEVAEPWQNGTPLSHYYAQFVQVPESEPGEEAVPAGAGEGA